MLVSSIDVVWVGGVLLDTFLRRCDTCLLVRFLVCICRGHHHVLYIPPCVTMSQTHAVTSSCVSGLLLCPELIALDLS